MERVKWEYKSFEATWRSRLSGPPMSDLNSLGSDGWEFAGYVPFPDGADGPGKGGPCGWFVFKRPKG